MQCRDLFVKNITAFVKAAVSFPQRSFYVAGFEPKAGSGRIAPALLKTLRETKLEVPAWFLELVKCCVLF